MSKNSSEINDSDFIDSFHLGLNGEIPREFQNALRAHRLDLRLSYQELGKILDVNWSTVRKWELGISTKCHPRHRRKLLDFINGRLDSCCHKHDEYSLPAPSLVPEVSSKVQNCFHQISLICHLARKNPSLLQQYTEEILKLIANFSETKPNQEG